MSGRGDRDPIVRGDPPNGVDDPIDQRSALTVVPGDDPLDDGALDVRLGQLADRADRA